jgi:hypothetical protein
VRLYSRRVVSFRLFRSRRFGFALRAFNLFCLLTVYVYVYVCARFVLSLSAIDSLQTHTRMRACAHTHTYRRWWEEGHTEEVGGRTTARERERGRVRERRSPYIYWRTRRLLCCLLDIWLLGGKYKLAFRSVPMTTMMTFGRVVLLRSYGDMISLLYTSYTSRIALFFFSYRYNNYYNSHKFLCHHINVYVCACISRDRENVPCFTAIEARSVDLVRMLICVCVSSP